MNFEDAKKEAKVSKIPKNVNIKNLFEPNIDTLTYSKAVKTNNKLSTVLKAKQALEFGKYFTFVNAALKPSDIQKNGKFDNLLFTNKKILRVLERIEENMIDEQDTSIKHKSKNSKNQTVIKNGIAQNAQNSGLGLGLGLDLIPKFKPKDKTKTNNEKTKDKTKENPKDKTKENPKDKTKENPKDKTKTNNEKNKTNNEKNKTNKEQSKTNNEKNKTNNKTSNTEKPIKKVEPTKKPVNPENKVNVENTNEVKANKTPFNKLSKKEQLELAKLHNQSTPIQNLPKEERRVLAEERARRMQLNNVKRTFIPKTARALAKGASLVGTGIVITEGVYQYVNAECEADRQAALLSTAGALGGAWAGAQAGALAGAWAGPIGMAAGALIGAGLGALAGSALGEWLSGKLKTPLDLIPDKFKNRGPKIEYVYIETQLLPCVKQMPYESQEDYNKAFDSVENRMIELVEEMKKGSTKEQEREWDKNRLINEDIVTDRWVFDFNSIKDWEKVETLPDSDLDILINDANLNDLDRDRVREIKFARNAKTNTNTQTAVSAIDRVNQAIEAEKKRLEEYRKENTYDSFTGGEIESENYRRSLKTIQELQQVKRTMLSQAEKGDFKSIEVDEKSRDVNNNSEKQFNSLTLRNTSSAEFFASRNFNADSFKTQWATSYSSHEDISKTAIADFSSIKADDIQFNKNDHLGFVSGEFESGGNPGVIAKDNIGYAYGAWQINSVVGPLRDFVKSIKNDERFAHLAELKMDSPEFQNEWARVAKEYPNAFLEKQHEFIEKTRFKPVLDYARLAGLNTTNRAVQEALWSQAVQHGFKGNQKIIDDAVKKVGKSSSPEEIVRALYESRADYVNGLSTLSDSLKAQINDRYKRETAKALAIVSNEDFQNSDITKSVNSDSDLSPVNLNEESNSESSENGVTQKSSKDETLATDISKTDKVPLNEMPIEDLNQNITIEQVIKKEESATPQKSSNEDTDLTQWTVQTPT